MAYIEGIGDEVVTIFAVVGCGLILIVAWLSTNVAQNPLTRIVIHHQTRRRRSHTSLSTVPTTDTAREEVPEPASVQQPVTVSALEIDDTRPSESPVSPEDTGSSSSNIVRVKEDGAAVSRPTSASDIIKQAWVAEVAAIQSEPVEVTEVRHGPLTPTELQSSSALYVETNEVDLDVNETSGHLVSSADVPLSQDANQSSPTNSGQSRSTSNNEGQISESESNSIEEQHHSSSNTAEGQISAEECHGVCSTDEGQTSSTVEDVCSCTTEQRGGAAASQSGASDTTARTPVGSADGRIRVILRTIVQEDRHVMAYPTDTIHEFKRNIFPEDSGNVKFIFHGQVLADNRTLMSYNVVDNTVVHIHISQNRQLPTAAASHAADYHQDDGSAFDHEAWDMGTYLFPFLGFVLSMVWYFRFTYRHVFNFTSTVALLFLTLMFVFNIYISQRNTDNVENQEVDDSLGDAPPVVNAQPS